MSDKKETGSSDVVVEKHIHRTHRQRILHVLCLLVPIVAAFGGYFVAEPLYGLFAGDEPAPEVFKLICSLVAFAIPATIIFFATRKENPIMKIGIFNR